MNIRNIFNVIRNYRGEEGEISFSELKKIKNSNPNSILLDVRSPQEYKEGHLNGAINIPLYELERCCSCNLKEKNKTIIVYCQSGIRSKKAIKILRKNEFNNLYHLKDGLDGIADFPIQ